MSTKVFDGDGKLYVRFEENITENKDRLKDAIPWAERRWDRNVRAWEVHPGASHYIRELFPDAQWSQGAIALAYSNPAPRSETRPKMTVTLDDKRIVMRNPRNVDRSQFMQWVGDQKQVPGRKFVKSSGCWIAPMSSIAWIIENWSERADIEIDQSVLDAYKQMQVLAEMSRASDGELTRNLPIPAGLKAYGYQKAGFNFLEAAGFNAILADDMGLGKTIQAILAIMALRDSGPTLVSCPATVKRNWERELKKWIPWIKTEIISGRTPDHTIDVDSVDVFIINHDILAIKDTERSTRKKIELTGWIDQLAAIEWALVVFDEGHKVANVQKSLRGKAAQRIARGAKHTIILTGTPIQNRPRELWPLLNMVDPESWGDFFSYAKRYCNAHQTRWGWDFNGSSNMDELHEIIKPWVLRRMKSDPAIGLELPAKTRADVVLELSARNRRAYDAEVARFAKLVRAQRVAPHDLLTHIGKLKVLAADAKLKQSIDFIKDFPSSGQKLIVFAWHKHIIDKIMEELSKAKIKAVKLTGETPEKQRIAAVDLFQNDPDTMVFVGNIQAAGEGITLTAASNVVFVEYGWKPGEHAQAEDRAYRIGQTAPVTVWYLNAMNTIDGTLFNIIDGKRRVVETIMDGATEKHTSSVLLMSEDASKWTDKELVDLLTESLFV